MLWCGKFLSGILTRNIRFLPQSICVLHPCYFSWRDRAKQFLCVIHSTCSLSAWKEMKILQLGKQNAALLNANYIPHPLCLYIIILDLYLNQGKRCSHPSFTDDGVTKLKKSWPHSGEAECPRTDPGLWRPYCFCSIRLSSINTLFFCSIHISIICNNLFNPMTVTYCWHRYLCFIGRRLRCRESHSVVH